MQQGLWQDMQDKAKHYKIKGQAFGEGKKEGGPDLAIIAVGKHNHESRLPQPLGFSTRQELVKNHLQQSHCLLNWPLVCC